MAKISEKREYNVSEIEEGKSVCVHGIPMNLSPIKKSRKNPDLPYVEGEITDGEKCARIVSFDTSLHSEMEKAQKPLAFDKSDVKPSKLSGTLEVHLNKKSALATSPRKLKGMAMSSQKQTKLGDLVDLALNQCIDIIVKVVRVGDIEQGRNLMVENYLSKMS